MEQLQRRIYNNMLIIISKQPEIYYISDAYGGIIYYCIHHLPFRLITYGTSDHAMMINLVVEDLRTHRCIVGKARTGSHVSNVMGDVAGIISSFIPIDDVSVQHLRSTSKRSMTSVNRLIYNRVHASIRIVSNQNMECQVNGSFIHGYLKMRTRRLNYIAVFFEGSIMGDSWFDDTDHLVSSRIFDQQQGQSVPIGQGTSNWFNSVYRDGLLMVGRNACPVDQWHEPGKEIICGNFVIKFIAKHSNLRHLYPRFISLDRVDVVIYPLSIDRSWRESNNLPSHYQEDDTTRQMLLTSRSESSESICGI